MLQIDESQLEVYSCSFQLVLGSTYLPLKFKDSCYYIDWKIKHKTSNNQTQPQIINQYGYLEFKKNLKLHTQILKNIKTQQFQKKYSQLTLFLISSKHPSKPKIVGSMLIGLHEVLNQQRYSEMRKNKLNLSPLNVEVEFKCLPIECGVSSVLEANLSSALIVNQNFLTKSGAYNCIPYKEDDKNFIKKKITAQLMEEDDGLSRGECSVLQPGLEDAFDNQSPIFQRSSLLINSASLISNPHLQLLTQVDLESETKIKVMQNQDLQTLVKENKNLKRLLMIVKNQRKLERERYEEQNRELARELSIKQAQLLKIMETHKSGSLKVGQLMDQAIGSNARVIALLKQTEAYKQKLTISQQYAAQLQQNHRRLEIRLQIVRDWQQERNFLLAKIQSLQEQNEHLKIQFYDLENKKSLAQEQQLTVVKQISIKLHQLEDELERRDKIITLYEEKVNKFEQQISLMQQEEIVSRVSYSAISETRQILNRQENSSQNTPKKRGKTSNNFIFIEEEGLNRIKEEELEQSLQTGEKQIATAAQLPETIINNESEFFRKMARNVQAELDQLRVLYRDKDTTISREKSYSKSLKEELQRLRFEFVYELSKVTSLLNQKILEIRELKEQNARLKQNEVSSYQSHIYKLQSEINTLQEQRLLYFDKCYRLEEQNISLMNLTREKQEIYQSMMKGSNEFYEQRKEEELIVTEFQKIVKVMENNQQRYGQTLKKHGFLSLFSNHTPLNNLSEIFKKQSIEYNASDCDSKTSSIPSQQDLLLESNAKIPGQTAEISDPSFFFQKMSGQLKELRIQREKSINLLKEMSQRSISLPKTEKIGPLIQSLKNKILPIKDEQVRLEILKAMKKMEQTLTTFIDCY